MTLASDVATIPGWYGKLPSLGDFASRRLEADFIEPWDLWLGEAMQAQRDSMGDAWLGCLPAEPAVAIHPHAGRPFRIRSAIDHRRRAHAVGRSGRPIFSVDHRRDDSVLADQRAGVRSASRLAASPRGHGARCLAGRLDDRATGGRARRARAAVVVGRVACRRAVVRACGARRRAERRRRRLRRDRGRGEPHGACVASHRNGSGSPAGRVDCFRQSRRFAAARSGSPTIPIIRSCS